MIKHVKTDIKHFNNQKSQKKKSYKQKIRLNKKPTYSKKKETS